MKPTQNRIIVVLGMHRSGTSTITRALNVLGVDLGDRLMTSAPGNNDKGFFEDVDINALNMRALGSLGLDWQSLSPIEQNEVDALRQQGYFLQAVDLLRQKCSAHTIFGFKDPRVAKLLPFWISVFQHCNIDVAYVIVVRNPLSVAGSLYKRDALDYEKSYLLWYEHVLRSLGSTAKCQRGLVDYDEFLREPRKFLNNLAQRLSLVFDAQKFNEFEDSFLDGNLRHNLFQSYDLTLDVKCPPVVRELYLQLGKISKNNLLLDAMAVQKSHADQLLGVLENSSVLRWIDHLLVKNSRLIGGEQTVNECIDKSIAELVRLDTNAFRKPFKASWYLKANPDVAAAGVDPYVHYVTQGYLEKRRPSDEPLLFLMEALFDSLFASTEKHSEANALREKQFLEIESEKQRCHDLRVAGDIEVARLQADLVLLRERLSNEEQTHGKKLVDQEQEFATSLDELKRAGLAEVQRLELQLSEREQQLLDQEKVSNQRLQLQVSGEEKIKRLELQLSEREQQLLDQEKVSNRRLQLQVSGEEEIKRLALQLSEREQRLLEQENFFKQRLQELQVSGDEKTKRLELQLSEREGQLLDQENVFNQRLEELQVSGEEKRKRLEQLLADRERHQVDQERRFASDRHEFIAAAEKESERLEKVFSQREQSLLFQLEQGRQDFERRLAELAKRQLVEMEAKDRSHSKEIKELHMMAASERTRYEQAQVDMERVHRLQFEQERGLFSARERKIVQLLWEMKVSNDDEQTGLRRKLSETNVMSLLKSGVSTMFRSLNPLGSGGNGAVSGRKIPSALAYKEVQDIHFREDRGQDEFAAEIFQIIESAQKTDMFTEARGASHEGQYLVEGVSSRLKKNQESLLDLNGEAFIEGAYEIVLGRPPDSAGMQHYLTKLESGESKMRILDILRDSDEAKNFRMSPAALDAYADRFGA